MRAAEVVNYKVINIHNVRDDADLGLFPGNMIAIADDLGVSSGDMYDGTRFFRPIVPAVTDSPAIPTAQEPDPNTEDDADDAPIGGEPAQ